MSDLPPLPAISTAPPGRTGALARKQRGERERTAVRCNNCGTYVDVESYVLFDYDGPDVSMCHACTYDYVRVCKPGVSVHDWIASNNPPGDPEP